MKRLMSVVVMGCLILSFASGVYAQEAAQVKMGYVDLGRIFDEYGKTKEYDESLAKKQTEFQNEYNKRAQKVTEETGKLNVLKEDEKNKLQTQIDKETADLREYGRLNSTDLKKERDERIKEILMDIEKVVKGYAEKEGYTVILNDRVLIYGNQSLDVTDQVIKLLNEKYPAKK
ncbi:MAG: OmpH family outer membrane protein [Candidatus Omnitrophota bacterium]